jgi:hypothetical protein
LSEAHERVPHEIVLDLDNTDIPLHGMQEGRFFHGHYDEYCYLPLLRSPPAAGAAAARQCRRQRRDASIRRTRRFRSSSRTS